jgi:hypothetical protein
VKLAPAAALAILALAVVGCDRLFAGQPAIQDLVGVYRLTDASQDFLRTTKHYKAIVSSEIELKSDSTVSIRNLPDCAVDGFGDSGGRFLSGDGRWRIKHDPTAASIDLVIDPGGSLKDGGYLGSWMKIRRRWPPHVLQITVGDPDSGQSIEYERQPSARSPAGALPR